MISFLKGKILEIFQSGCTVYTQSGVGYMVSLPLPVLERLPEIGVEIELYIHTVVKEDAIELFGFSSIQDRDTFRQLISISKLGPRTGLAILSTFDAQSLSEIILRQDVLSLTRVPGIGQKSAKRIIWELKEKLGSMDLGTISAATQENLKSSVFADARAGLLNLGYSDSEVRPALQQVLSEEPDLLVEEAIKKVLAKMSEKKL